MSDKDMRGITESVTGIAKLDRINTNGAKMGNIIKEYQVIDENGAKTVLADFYFPADTITTLAQARALGLAGYAKGSTLRTASTFLIKTSAPGAANADTWNIVTTAAAA